MAAPHTFQNIVLSTISNSQGTNINNFGLGVHSMVFLTPTANIDFTGLSGGLEGKPIWIHNNGSFTVTIKHNSGFSDAANRIVCPGFIDFRLRPGETIGAVYLTTAWRLEATPQGSQLFYGAMLFKGTNQAVLHNGGGSGAPSLITFNTETKDPYGLWTSGTEFTCDRAGVWEFTPNLRIDGNVAGQRQIHLLKAGVSQKYVIRFPHSSVAYSMVEAVEFKLLCAVGDILSIGLYQDSGVTLNVLTGSTLEIEYKGFI
jgi:hypothetical protein